jgi:hypothetical protein
MMHRKLVALVGNLLLPFEGCRQKYLQPWQDPVQVRGQLDTRTINVSGSPPLLSLNMPTASVSYQAKSPLACAMVP